MNEQPSRAQPPLPSESHVRELLRQIARIVVRKLPRCPANKTANSKDVNRGSRSDGLSSTNRPSH